MAVEELELGSFIPQAAITWAGPNALKQQAIVLDFACDGRYQDGSRFEMGDYSGWWLVKHAAVAQKYTSTNSNQQSTETQQQQ